MNKKNNERENGFYWVKYKEDGRWLIAEWQYVGSSILTNERCWLRIGYTGWCDDSYFYIIDETKI